MEFVNHETGEKFECPQGWPSERRREAIGRTQEEKTKAMAELAEDFKEVYATQKLPLKERQDLFRDNPQLSAQVTVYSNRVTGVINRATRAACRASLDTKSLTPERRALIESDVDGDFWLEQSVPVLEDAVERFQQAYQRGQRGDRPDPRVAGDEAAADERGAAGVPEEAARVGDGAGA